jgi:hypothetical protein
LLILPPKNSAYSDYSAQRILIKPPFAQAEFRFVPNLVENSSVCLCARSACGSNICSVQIVLLVHGGQIVLSLAIFPALDGCVQVFRSRTGIESGEIGKGTSFPVFGLVSRKTLWNRVDPLVVIAVEGLSSTQSFGWFLPISPDAN